MLPQLSCFASSGSACRLWLAAQRPQGERSAHKTPSHCLGRDTASFERVTPKVTHFAALTFQAQGMFWFAHKPVRGWITEFMDPTSNKYLRRVRAGSVGKQGKSAWVPMCVRP